MLRPAPVLAWLVAAASAGAAHAQLRVVNYNIAQLRGDTLALQDVFAALAADDRPGFATAPAVIAMQEVRGVDRPILEALVAAANPGVPYATATFTTSAFEDGNGGAQLLIYRSDLLYEVTASHKDLATGAGRNSDRWQLRLVGYDSPLASLWIYSTHLKAGNAGSDAATRLAGAQTLRADADTLPSNAHVLFMGDFNFGSSSEGAYLHFLTPGSAECFDPLGSGSWSGGANAIKHSQSPRDITADGLTGGGMNDRFDLQLPSTDFNDNDGLSLLPGTYRAFGNDGLHFNQAINAGNNFYWPGNVAASNALADDLFDASDHVPVVAEYRVPAVMSAAIDDDFGRVIRNSTATVQILVANIADVVVPAGAAPLQYSAVGLAGLGGPVSGFVGALPEVATVNLPIDTSEVGFLLGVASVTSSSQAVQFPSYTLFTSGEVLRAANPSFFGIDDVDVFEFEFEFQAGSGVQGASIPLFNFGWTAQQALLDVDTVTGAFPPVAAMQPYPKGIGAGTGAVQLQIDTNIAPGVYGSALTIACSDEDIPGEKTSLLGAIVTVTILPGGNPADLDGNGVVNGADLGILLGLWGVCPAEAACIADLNGDGVVNGADLGALLAAWG